MTAATSPVLRAVGVSRDFGTGAGVVHACRSIDLEVSAGELLIVRGRSGSGKTTLLGMLGTLDRPTSGQVWLGDRELSALGEDALTGIRREHIGFVFQTFGLIPVLSAAENVEIPLRIRGVDPAQRQATVLEMLELVGLADHAEQRPYELSGGQQQRVGLARALAARPDILLADEPTGQLDSRTAAAMMDLIESVVRSRGIAAVVSTHDPLLIDRADRVITLHDGAVTA
jgi:putative ABC transport system ATP-binding protein